MTPIPAELAAALRSTSEPTLILDAQGRIVHANPAATKQLGGEAVGIDLAAAQEAGACAFRRWLALCEGTSEPLVGSMRIGARRFQARGARLPLGSDPHVVIRFTPRDPRFAALTAKIAELNAEVRRRRLSEAALAEAVAARDLLLRELQHRVKNTLHMLVGLLKMTAREAESDEARRALIDVSRRLGAVAAGQQLLYQLDRHDSVEAGALVDAVAQAAMALDDDGRRLELETASGSVSNDRAAPLALIVNELVTNALKYGGGPNGGGAVRVSLLRSGGAYTLRVSDDGPGFDAVEAKRRASGLGLVRGLAAQLGGEIRFEPGPGGRCTLRFEDETVREIA